jgi:hypothetical protein
MSWHPKKYIISAVCDNEIGPAFVAPNLQTSSQYNLRRLLNSIIGGMIHRYIPTHTLSPLRVSLNKFRRPYIGIAYFILQDTGALPIQRPVH